MQADEQADPSPNKEHYTPRKLESVALADLLPLKGIEANSKRVFNIWGESRVGKTTFISSFRESEHMLKNKVLWLQPTRDDELDSIPEFIRACAKTTRYPASPEKEKDISQRIESVERGKINPVVSDDSILITRSNIAKEKRPYINMAAASSVGRTETVRDDFQISVGLGESKGNNQAEGFLDTLPLQSLGTDLTILYIEKFERLSITLQDWIRDYLIPAATRGAYRRNIVFLVESRDPMHLEHPSLSWGEWDHSKSDFRLHPMSEEDTYMLALASSLEPDQARYVFRQSQGYPTAALSSIQAFKNGALSAGENLLASQILEPLSNQDKAKLAALCLPSILYPDDLDVFFGHLEGKTAVQWLQQIPNIPIKKTKDEKGHTLSINFRYSVVTATNDLQEFKLFKRKWAALSRVIHNAPSRVARSNLLLLSGLNWIDETLCKNLFGDQAERVLGFITSKDTFFNRNMDHYRVSECVRSELQKTAQGMGHIGMGSVRKKAESLWKKRSDEINSKISALEQQIEEEENNASSLERKQAEISAQLRIVERNSHPSAAPPKGPQNTKSGVFVFLLAILAVTLAAAGTYLPDPYNYSLYIAGLISIGASLAYLPQWMAYRKAVAFNKAAENVDSPEFVRKQGADAAHEYQAIESKIDELRRELEDTQRLLDFPYV